ncbi:hypothetical protein LNN38_27080, partial [Pseudomonas sp. LA21]|uniref:hypothetical protein n=1 Tax=Pseudomonas sp. LA21 TaxID=2893373 RepID=UPI001FB758E7
HPRWRPQHGFWKTILTVQGLPSMSLATLMSRVLQSIAVTSEGKEGGLESFLELFDGRNLVLRAQKN